jgi:phosphate starvation-inducible PhoH-like protein
MESPVGRRNEEKRERKNMWRERQGMEPLPAHDQDPARYARKPLSALTEAQGHYLISMEGNQLTFGVGPAGTGKTYVCAAKAAEMLLDKQIGQIIITRPMVTAGKGAGYLPGELEEKFAPFFEPFLQVFYQRLGRSHYENLVRNEKIVAKPLDYIRGLTFDNAFVILDEAQNTTPEQMKLFLTRIGEHSRVVVNGDILQKDIQGLSGLEDAVYRFRGMKQVSVVEFDEDDIVRSGLVKEILKRYRNPA